MGEAQKPVVKMKNWHVSAGRLVGDVDYHHTLGACHGGFVTTSQIVRVETLNTIYEVENWGMKHKDKVQAREVENSSPAKEGEGS